MDTIIQQGNQLLELLKTSVEEQKLEQLDWKQEWMDCDKRSTINSQIGLAKALGDCEELQCLSNKLKESQKVHSTT